MTGKTEIVEYLGTKHGLTKVAAEEVVKDLVSMIVTGANDGGFKIPDIGTFLVVTKAARKARNPKTGETVDVPAKKAVKFKIAKGFKDAVK